jgi:rhamnose utilization protein RhaD (predicted bifunctional aldolase and dehydrogenase)/NAD(P)-dependent dehydrogenase (short-subunit alcohol dehydrogenase family)
MRSKWSDDEAAGFVARYGPEWGEPLALRTYSSRLLGGEPALVLHGGGNSSVKARWANVLGDDLVAVFVKASGTDMATIEPFGHPGLDLEYLRRLRALPDLDDAVMVAELRAHLLRADDPTPSIEALVHAFLPGIYIDHTHADAILALTNQDDGEAVVGRALGEDVIVLPYTTPGFKLALAAAAALKARPSAWGMVWAHHGIVTWGSSARDSYDLMINLVSRAEHFLQHNRGPHGAKIPVPRQGAASEAGTVRGSKVRAGLDARPVEVATILRGLLAADSGDTDRPHRRVILQTLADPEMLAVLSAPWAREALVTPPLTTDHLIRTKALPLWIDSLHHGDEAALREQLRTAVEQYSEEYRAYLERNAAALPAGVETFDPRPRVVMIPGLGTFCAGPDLRESLITRDITVHTIAVKAAIAASDSRYKGLPEDELFAMEYRTLQHAKLERGPAQPMRGQVALITGAAGAIGTGICRGLLEAGCLVAATDLPGEPLSTLVTTLRAEFGESIIGLPLDVTDPGSVAEAFAGVVQTWGGVDLVIPNAGVAHVAQLIDLSLEKYRKLEQVNVEGTLLLLAEAARHFKRQGTGGDVVLISTKNVFAPGAGFGGYSSTKAAAHQLARIASLELAADDVRVNMVAPDAVFSCGTRRSGLWDEVGPGRMKARGLDEAGLEAYYQGRNLLKAQVTAEHVARAVLFFATRQTPTTGATIPVDGGLPDSTPR